MDYFSLIPKDVKDIVNLNVIMNYDYNKFIDYCQDNKCNEELWRNKGLKDFEEFDGILGNTNQAKYLRHSSIEEREKLQEFIKPSDKKLNLERNEYDYRHQAKLLDYDGNHDNYHSFYYFVGKWDIVNLDCIGGFEKYLPQSMGKWLVFIIERKHQSPYFVLKGEDKEYKMFDLRLSLSNQLFKENIEEELGNWEEGLKIYDVII